MAAFDPIPANELNYQAPPPLMPIALRFGLLTGFVSVVFSLATLLTKTDQTALKWVGVLISAGGIYLAHQEYKKQNGGYMSYGQGLGLGTLVALISGLMGSIFFYLYITAIDTTYVPHLIETTRAQMEAQGKMTDDQIEQAMTMSTKFMQPGMMFTFGLLGSAFFGFIVSLVVAAITKNTRPEFE